MAEAPHPFLLALGARLRTLRSRRGLTRRALAEAAGVSERHLANLEAGTGNASILVLLQVANGLQCPLADLLASGATARDPERARRVALVGLRGAGKSALGARLADDLGFPFVEIGREIERLAGGSVAEIQALYGPAAYRRYERRALEETIAAHGEAVIAAPGGVVSEPSAYALLLERCTTVWLQATPEDHMQRVVAQGDLRPMAASAEAMADLKTILAGREPYYARAAIKLDTSAQPIEPSFRKLRAEVRAALQMPL